VPEVYFDNAATTPVAQEISEQLVKLLENQYYNADSLYDNAIFLKKKLEEARTALATLLQVDNQEIIFTSGASEGNNLIIRGVIDFYQGRRKHLITSTVEHSSVKEVFDYYEKLGYQVDRIGVNQQGEFDWPQFKQTLRPDTLLVSIMAVNNEVGTILPVNEIGRFIKANSRALLHSDMTQALAKVPVSLQAIDFASFSAHKFGAPKGSGFIYKRQACNLVPLIMGGQQEFNLRAGTSNVAYDISLVKCLELAQANDSQKIVDLKEQLLKSLQTIAEVQLNSEEGSPFMVNFSLENVTSQVAINALAKKGIMVSGQSTCSTKKHEYSVILKNMGFPEKVCRNSLRVSFWHQNTAEEVEYFIKCLKEIIAEYGI
jgi:cysteine desulfurase